MGKANVSDQKLQAVLYIMGADLGRTGIDGDSGPKTFEATRKAADKIYASMAGGMSNSEAISTVLKGDIGSRDHMRQVVTKKLEDPEFRAAALEKLKEMPQNKDTIIAMQTVLQAAYGNTLYDVTNKNGKLMTGVMDDATRVALKMTEGGRPSEAVFAQLGISKETYQVAMNGAKDGGSLSQSYNFAAAGVQIDRQAPRQQLAMAAPSGMAP